jgi:glycosyltransferase involved in cell wall biosynthesis
MIAARRSARQGHAMPTPLVTVLLPVRDGAPFLDAALASIRAQTLAELEILVVDDGSRDATPVLLARHAAEDARLRVLTRGASGLVAALNLGLAEARAPLVARMDADDVAAPARLERQAREFHARPALAVLGTACRLTDASGMVRGVMRFPEAPDAVRAALSHANCVAHPSVMLRRDAARAAGGYRAAFVMAEDYDLWLRLSRRHEVANLPEALLDYREHPAQASRVAVAQRILSELAARRCAERVAEGLPEAAPRTPVTRADLLALGLTDARLAR